MIPVRAFGFRVFEDRNMPDTHVIHPPRSALDPRPDPWTMVMSPLNATRFAFDIWMNREERRLGLLPKGSSVKVRRAAAGA